MKNQLSEILKPSAELHPLPTGVSSDGTILANIRAVIFDIYGTLLISGSGDVGSAIEAGSTDAFLHALVSSGIENPDTNMAEELKNRFFELISDTHKKMKADGIPYPEVDIVEIWKGAAGSAGIRVPDFKVLAAVYESIVNPVYPMPGAFKLINSLRERNLKLGIVSNAQFYTPIIFDAVFEGGFKGLGFRPELCFFSYIEKRSKPDTYSFERLLERLSGLGIRPEESLFVGNDMLKDILPSSETGMKTALFTGDSRSLRMREDHDACRNLKPDVIVNTLADLTDYIQEG